MSHPIYLDYPVKPAVRFGWDSPPHAQLYEIISRREDHYRARLQAFQAYAPELLSIPLQGGGGEAHWVNDWFPMFDAITLYGFVAETRPRRVVEIGSGVSTTFIRRAITDRGLDTVLTSVDPQPRSEIDALCDRMIRSPLEEADLRALFGELRAGDLVYFDGSHRSFQNSDVTVFFTEVLPLLPPGVLVGVHDVFLPHDYPENWATRLYSEQYLLACWLLAGERLQVELPNYHCRVEPRLAGAADPLASALLEQGAGDGAGLFWFTIRG